MFARWGGRFTKSYWSILVIAIVTVSNASRRSHRAQAGLKKVPRRNLITALIYTR